MKKNWKKANIRFNSPIESILVPIVADAAVATRGVGDGRFIPLLILDTTSRPDLQELIRVHGHLGPGDVNSLWARPPRTQRTLRLILSFRRPVQSVLMLQFDLTRQYSLVDAIVRSEAVYLQAGKPGDRLRSTVGASRIVCEVPSKAFAPEWEHLLHRVVVDALQRKGIPRARVQDAARQMISMWRQVTDYRFRNS
ncbi:MAG: hypothetical protein JXA57_19240 [Armatimonadetes bacterium]|nr:hypothetical protein [Armatimonadota bacterium]